jgi:sporulation protein YlmC with PRC-barrel domain
MTPPREFTLGTAVQCSDAACGVVSRVVLDPIARSVTHLVVEPKHLPGLGRLVPLDLVEGAPGGLLLRCTSAEFQALELAEETQFRPGGDRYPGYGPGQALAWPYYGLGGGLGGGMSVDAMATVPFTVTFDAVPLGEVAVRRNEQVHALDGDIGRVQGLVIEPESHQVTHVLLQEGHLWGRREVAIPISAVVTVDDDGIHLGLTKEQVQGLPTVDLDRPSS